MTDGPRTPVSFDADESAETDACVDALGQALSMLKAAEVDDGPSLAEIMRLVRLMESQPDHAIARLRQSLDRWSDVPTPEKVRRVCLQARGHTEASLGALPAGERAALETALAEDIRRHFGVASPPPIRKLRPPPLSPFTL